MKLERYEEPVKDDFKLVEDWNTILDELAAAYEKLYPSCAYEIGTPSYDCQNIIITLVIDENGLVSSVTEVIDDDEA